MECSVSTVGGASGRRGPVGRGGQAETQTWVSPGPAAALAPSPIGVPVTVSCANEDAKTPPPHYISSVKHAGA